MSRPRPRLQAQRGACVMSRGVTGREQAKQETDRDVDGNSDRSTCDVEIHKKLIDRFGGHCRTKRIAIENREADANVLGRGGYSFVSGLICSLS